MRSAHVPVDRFQWRLMAWYRCHGRALPWPGTRHSYRILVSEIMLEQTQVERVRKFRGGFLRRYPSFRVLASASQPAAREAWDGLGYRAQADNLRRTAQIVESGGATENGCA